MDEHNMEIKYLKFPPCVTPPPLFADDPDLLFSSNHRQIKSYFFPPVSYKASLRISLGNRSRYFTGVPAAHFCLSPLNITDMFAVHTVNVPFHAITSVFRSAVCQTNGARFTTAYLMFI